ncbi:MAG: hypothetical protein ACYTA5_19505, partial [Planctomycetota bacterium]
IDHGDTFTLFPDGTIQSGLVDEFGGSQLDGNVGVEPKWARIGWITMKANLEVQTCTIALLQSTGGVAVYGLGLVPWESIELGSVDLEIVPPVRSYDRDGDGCVGVGDLSKCAPCWLKKNPPKMCDPECDFDCDGDVFDPGDLSWFAIAWNKCLDDPSIIYAPCECSQAAAASFALGREDVPQSLGLAKGMMEQLGTPDVSADIDLELVVLSASSTSDIVTNLPTSINSISVGQTYYLEVWVSDVGDINTGLTSVYVDLNYPAGAASVTSISHGGIFTEFDSGSATSGIIDELGGSALPGGDGIEPEWARVAIVEMHVDAASPTLIFNLTSSDTGVAAKVRGEIPWEDVSLGIAAVGEDIPGDFNGDGDVDQDDFDTFESCASGPVIPHDGSPTCQYADFDSDNDVDQNDFAIFQRCYSGENNPGDPSCAN